MPTKQNPITVKSGAVIEIVLGHNAVPNLVLIDGWPIRGVANLTTNSVPDELLTVDLTIHPSEVFHREAEEGEFTKVEEIPLIHNLSDAALVKIIAMAKMLRKGS